MHTAASEAASRLCTSVYQEQRPTVSTGRGLADLTQQLDQVLLGCPRTGDAGHGTDVEFQLYPSRGDHGEGLDHPEGPLGPLAGAVLAAQLPEQPGRHLGEGRPEARLGADLLHVGRGPPRLGGEDVQLHERTVFPTSGGRKRYGPGPSVMVVVWQR
jgi:hypothetical protein